MKKGFTLLEILLVIAAIGILAVIVILAINPQRQLSQVRNAQRQSEMNTISKALNQYLIDTGEYPAGIQEYYLEVCNTGAETVGGSTDCTGYLDLRPLVPEYVASIPSEPNASDQAGYKVRERDGSLQLISTNSELSQLIGINNKISGLESLPFGGNGRVTQNFGGSELFFGVVNNGDDIYVGGYTSASGSGDAFVMKYDIDGNLDTSYGGGDGIVQIANGQPNEFIGDLEVLDSGVVYALGRYGSGASFRSFVVRITPEGVLDTDFGNSGYYVYPQTMLPFDIEVNEDESSYIAGYVVDGGGYSDGTILKVNSSGVLDAGFGSGGVITYDNASLSPTHYIYAYSIDLDEQGGLYLTGDIYNDTGSQWENMYVRKYSASDGALDTTFGGGDGEFLSGDVNEGGYSIQIANNSLYVGGYDWYNDDWVSAVWKLSLDGVLDVSYGGGDGIAIDTVSDESYPSAGESLVIDGQGNVYLTGALLSPASEGIIQKFNANGDLDQSFFTDGIWYSSTPGFMQATIIYEDHYLYSIGSRGNDAVIYRME